jgi:hypothetical protein
MAVKAKWIIDKSMKDEFRKVELMALIERLGYEAHLMQYIPFSRKEDIVLPYDINDCVIPYSTINLGKHLKGYYGSYLNEDALKFNYYYSLIKLPYNFWVNGDFLMTTFFDFTENFEKYEKFFGTNKLFIRPNSGSKLFTGLPILGKSDMEYQSNALRQLSGVLDDSIIMVSTAKEIKEEFRFIIVGDEVIDGSRYNLNGEHTELHFYTTAAWELANKVAKSPNKPTEIFTCDIAEMGDGSIKIVELNSFNCAGWYHCDPEVIIKKVSEYVERRYAEDML